jgi:hypothetical protein
MPYPDNMDWRAYDAAYGGADREPNPFEQREINETVEAAMKVARRLREIALEIAAMEFPLSCPVPGYDGDDIAGPAIDWSKMPDDAALRARYEAEAFEEVCGGERV